MEELDIFINGQNALTVCGARANGGFTDSLLAFPPLKDNIENKSRLQDGKRVIIKNKRYDSRELTLSFGIMKTNDKSCMENVAALRTILEQGLVTIQIPSLTNEVFRLLYTGKSATHSLSLSKKHCVVTVKFEEPDPSNRGSEDKNSITTA